MGSTNISLGLLLSIPWLLIQGIKSVEDDSSSLSREMFFQRPSMSQEFRMLQTGVSCSQVLTMLETSVLPRDTCTCEVDGASSGSQATFYTISCENFCSTNFTSGPVDFEASYRFEIQERTGRIVQSTETYTSTRTVGATIKLSQEFNFLDGSFQSCGVNVDGTQCTSCGQSTWASMCEESMYNIDCRNADSNQGRVDMCIQQHLLLEESDLLGPLNTNLFDTQSCFESTPTSPLAMAASSPASPAYSPVSPVGGAQANADSEPPTDSPSASPSASPSKLPSGSPTNIPTRSPSVSPSVSPSSSPVSVKTSAEDSPGITLLVDPTASPSVSSAPSVSFRPTTSEPPSAGPSVSHRPTTTTSPSAFPSTSQQPSSFPSDFPSNVPSTSNRPTVSPAPSAGQSSEIPSLFPTGEPTSSSPTASPTSLPSDFPSTVPSVSSAPSELDQTDVPTTSPTGTPTALPTVPRTSSPTGPPSLAPTSPPTLPPTLAPTNRPTISSQPTLSFAPSSGTETPTVSSATQVLLFPSTIFAYVEGLDEAEFAFQTAEYIFASLKGQFEELEEIRVAVVEVAGQSRVGIQISTIAAVTGPVSEETVRKLNLAMTQALLDTDAYEKSLRSNRNVADFISIKRVVVERPPPGSKGNGKGKGNGDDKGKKKKKKIKKKAKKKTDRSRPWYSPSHKPMMTAPGPWIMKKRGPTYGMNVPSSWTRNRNRAPVPTTTHSDPWRNPKNGLMKYRGSNLWKMMMGVLVKKAAPKMYSWTKPMKRRRPMKKRVSLLGTSQTEPEQGESSQDNDSNR